MAEAIDKFGARLIGLAAFMAIGLAAVFFIFARQKKLDTSKDADYSQMFAAMQTQNQETFAKLFQVAFKQDNNEIITESINAMVAIREYLKNAVGITKADRSSIYAFHNGVRMLGKHLARFSCWAEYPALPIYDRSEKHKGVEVIRIPEICAALMSPEKRWEMLEPISGDSQENRSWIEPDTKSAFAHAIYAADGNILGFAFVEYIDMPISPAYVARARDEAKSLSDKVSLALDIELK